MRASRSTVAARCRCNARGRSSGLRDEVERCVGIRGGRVACEPQASASPGGLRAASWRVCPRAARAPAGEIRALRATRLERKPGAKRRPRRDVAVRDEKRPGCLWWLERAELCAWSVRVRLLRSRRRAAGGSSSRPWPGSSRPRRPAGAAWWSCAVRWESARRRCSSTRSNWRRTSGCCGRWASSPRWSLRSRPCISCARRCTSSSIGFLLRSVMRLRSRSG